MKCHQAYRFICDHLDEKSTSPRCRAIRKHISSCPRCQEYLDSVKTTVRLYQAAPDGKLTLALHRDLMKALDLALPGAEKKTPRRARH